MDEAKQSAISDPTASIENTGETSISEREQQETSEGTSQPLPPLSEGGGDREAKPASSASKASHHQSYSDICTPRTVVIHDVSDSEDSSEENEQDLNGNLSMDMDSDLVKNDENEVEDGEENIGQESSGGEALPVSMHLPFNNSLSSTSLGGSSELRSARGTNEIDGSSLGEMDVTGNVAEHAIAQQAAPECMTPVPEVPESNGGDAIQASDLVVLAEEVNRLERELEASQAHVAVLQKQQRQGAKGRTPKGKNAVPNKGGESSEGGDAGEEKKKGGRTLEIIHSMLQGEIDDGDFGHIRSRLLRAEHSIEIERQKVFKLESKFALDSQMVANGEKAVNDMAKVKSELNRIRSENEKLGRDLKQERERVELLRAQLSKLIAAGESQVEDQQRMQHGLEASTKDAREARLQLVELMSQHQALQIEARDLRARTEISEKVAIEARRGLEAYQKSADSLAKENSELSSMVQKQASQIQQMKASAPSDQVVGPVVPESRPGGGRASHEAQHQSPNFPDPPSTELVAESSKPPAVEHDLELVVLAQEVDRLEKELAKEKSAKIALMEELRGVERESGRQSDGGKIPPAKEVSSSIVEGAKEVVIAETKVPQLSEPVAVGEEPVVDNGNISPSVTSQLTVLQPPKAQSQSKGWGFGLWGFIAGSDLVDE